jgi:hypothetical protein
MLREIEKLLLVGDNPFHGISHLSEDRIRARGDEISRTEYAAGLVIDSLRNGANGFMFSVSETTLSILRVMSEQLNQEVELHAIVPYAYEYVRLATRLGTLGLGRNLVGRIFFSGNLKAIATGFQGVVLMDLVALMKTYIRFEYSRILSSIAKKQRLTSILLHEVITDMAIALNLDWFFREYVRFVSGLGVKPGFETRNFSYLVKKFKEWDMNFDDIMLVSSFNKVGFQMNPSQISCEEALASIPECDVVAMSILAAGYISLPDAVDYIEQLPNLRGMVVGVSKPNHARETFTYLKSRFCAQSNI